MSGLRCTEPGCLRPVKLSDVRRIMTDTQEKRYNAITENRRVATDPSLKWCPNRQCSSVVQRLDGTSLRMDCTKCHTVFCFSCSGPYHPTKTCRQAKKFKLFPDDLRTSLRKIWEHPKGCPSCGVRVIKISGCNVVTCTACKQSFCWSCEKPFSGHSHRDCPHYGSKYSPFNLVAHMFKPKRRRR